jgi:hypothetical protein
VTAQVHGNYAIRELHGAERRVQGRLLIAERTVVMPMLLVCLPRKDTFCSALP